MFESKTTYKNRYGDRYRWEPYTLENVYVFRMEGNSLEFCRCGGKEGQQGLDKNDLGMFDPSGGPYVGLGTKIDGKEIVKISSLEDTFVVEVKKD
jgi:hypothetical protein